MLGIPPILNEMIDAAKDSCDNFRAAITNVKPNGFSGNFELISFEIERREGIKDECAGKYVGTLRGRNRDFVVMGNGGEGEKSVALRVFLDGDATKV